MDRGQGLQTMCFWNSVLLCLGLCLSSVTGTTEEKLRKPSLWAMPSPAIPVGSPVRIRCRGPPGARLYYLEKAGRPESLLSTQKPWPRNEVSFLISAVSKLHAGPYRCSYRLLKRWSQPSDALELVVTGVPLSDPHLLMELSTSTSLEAGVESCSTAVPGPNEDGGTSGPETAAGPTLQDYTVPNLIRISLMGLVVAILGALLTWSGWRDIGPHSGCSSHGRHRHSPFLRRPLPCLVSVPVTQEEKCLGGDCLALESTTPQCLANSEVPSLS